MRSEHDARLLISCFGLKVIHSLGDAESAAWASGLLPDVRETYISPNGGGQAEVLDVITGVNKATFSVSEKYEPTLRPGFFYGLKRGGSLNRGIVQAVVIKAGEPFKSNLQNWILVDFKQD